MNEIRILHVPKEVPDEDKQRLREEVKLDSGDWTLSFAARMLAAKAIHPIRHYWVEYRVYDPASKRIVVVPHARVCVFCPKGRLG